MGPGRLNALIDGVFAIALTLLVLDLPRPAGSSGLAHDLLREWPAYVAYLVSFVTVGILWIEHHGMMSAVRQISRRFLERTLLFLLLLSIIPWPTAIASAYARHGSQASAAVVLYGTVMMLMGLSFSFSWRYLAGHPELVAEPARGAVPAGTWRALLGGLAYLPAIVIGLFLPIVSFGIDAAIAAYFAVSKSEVPGLIHRAAEETMGAA